VTAAASPADRACEDAVSVKQLTQWTAVEGATGVVDDDDDSVVTSSQHCVIDDPMIDCKGKGKGKRSIAALKTPRRYGNSHAITRCYLPPDRGDIPALSPAEAGTRLSDPGWMQG